jgi:hypothetical protein
MGKRKIGGAQSEFDSPELRPKLSEEEALRILRAELEDEDGGRLSFANFVTIDQIERHGICRTFLRQRRDLKAQNHRLAHALRKADARLGTDTDGGLAAAIEALDAVMGCNGLGLSETQGSAALEQLALALRDTWANIPNPMFLVKGSGGLRPGGERARFEGELAGLLEVLTNLLGTQSSAFGGSNPTAVEVRHLAKLLADRRGWNWTEATPETVHRKTIGEWCETSGTARRSGPGRKGRPRVLDRLRALSTFVSSDLGQYEFQRLTALSLITAADHAKDRGEDLHAWCIGHARTHWALDRRLAAKTT